MGYFLPNKHVLPVQSDKQISVDKIINDALASFNIRLIDVVKRHRGQNIIEIRHSISYILHAKCGLWATETGAIIHRHHATVLHSCEVIEDAIWSYNRGILTKQYNVYIKLYELLKCLGIENSVIYFKKSHLKSRYLKKQITDAYRRSF